MAMLGPDLERPSGDTTSSVLDAANDLGDKMTVDACRQVIDADLRARLLPNRTLPSSAFFVLSCRQTPGSSPKPLTRRDFQIRHLGSAPVRQPPHRTRIAQASPGIDLPHGVSSPAPYRCHQCSFQGWRLQGLAARERRRRQALVRYGLNECGSSLHCHRRSGICGWTCSWPRQLGDVSWPCLHRCWPGLRSGTTGSATAPICSSSFLAIPRRWCSRDACSSAVSCSERRGCCAASGKSTALTSCCSWSI